MNGALGVLVGIVVLAIIAWIVWMRIISPMIEAGKAVKNHIDSKKQSDQSQSMLDDELKRYSE